jgi:hypothetical protein
MLNNFAIWASLDAQWIRVKYFCASFSCMLYLIILRKICFPQGTKYCSSSVTWRHCSAPPSQDILHEFSSDHWNTWIPSCCYIIYCSLRNNLDNVCLFIMYDMFAWIMCCPTVFNPLSLSLLVSLSFLLVAKTYFRCSTRILGFEWKCNFIKFCDNSVCNLWRDNTVLESLNIQHFRMALFTAAELNNRSSSWVSIVLMDFSFEIFYYDLSDTKKGLLLSSTMSSGMTVLNISNISQSRSTQNSPHSEGIGKNNFMNCLLKRMNWPEFKKLLLKPYIIKYPNSSSGPLKYVARDERREHP